MKRSQRRKVTPLLSSVKSIGIMILTGILAMSPCLSIKAAQNMDPESQMQLKYNLLEITSLLKECMQASYENAVSETETEIARKGYDYELTMESFYENSQPFAGYDYLSLIATYAVLKKNNNALGISDINFVKTMIQPDSIVEYMPKEINICELQENGTYSLKKRYVNYETDIPAYRETETGYELTGEIEHIKPETTITTYGNVKLHIISADELFSIFHVKKTEELELERDYRKSVMEQSINGRGLSQSTFISVIGAYGLTEDQKAEIAASEESTTDTRKQLIETALSLLGRVPYEWGGKSEKAGYDTSWWTYRESGKQKGLDCSGYIQWVMRTAGMPDDIWQPLVSTGTMLGGCEDISSSQLQPGDLGLLNHGEKINHVGMYLGNGNWIHCSSSKDTVIITKDFPFTIFKKIKKIDEISLAFFPSTVYYTDKQYCTEAEIHLIAQLVYNEAIGEGVNDWVAVTEVVKNRLESEDYPDTIEGVIYEDGQFENNEQIVLRNPPEELVTIVRETMNGNMSVLNNKDVLHFRNPQGDEGDWGTYQLYQAINNLSFYIG